VGGRAGAVEALWVDGLGWPQRLRVLFEYVFIVMYCYSAGVGEGYGCCIEQEYILDLESHLTDLQRLLVYPKEKIALN
jgi:hypothetical protein